MVDATMIVGTATVAITMIGVLSYIAFEWRKSSRYSEAKRQAEREAGRKELLSVIAEDRKERRARDLIVDAKFADVCDRLTRLETRFDDHFGVTTSTEGHPGART